MEVVLEGLSPAIEEGTVQVWFREEGDLVKEGQELVELSTEEGSVLIKVPVSGILTEVYYDEGEAVNEGEVLCLIEEADDIDAEEEEEGSEE